jgi:hypothetical protein
MDDEPIKVLKVPKGYTVRRDLYSEDGKCVFIQKVPVVHLGPDWSVRENECATANSYPRLNLKTYSLEPSE